MRVRVASAGTGKTTALVARVLELVDEGVPLRRIAGVTYTRTAAAELRQRVGDGVAAVLRDGHYLEGLVAPPPTHRPRFEEAARELGGATLATIHGFLIAALRLVAPPLGIDPAFVLYGEAEAVASYEEEVRSLLFLAQDPEHPLAPAVARLGPDALRRSRALFVRRSLAADLRPADDAAADLLTLHAAAYERALARAGAARMAPSEIERAAVRLTAVPALAARVVARYPVLLVDEYQDVNPLQGRLFEALERAGARVEVVGDPKQSIYGFRQADVAVFRRAAAAAAAAGTLVPALDRTRRHARGIAAFLNHLTGTLGDAELGFTRHEAPDVVPAGAQATVDGVVELHWWRHDEVPLDALRPAEEAALGARLRRLHEAGRPWREMAVLARSHVVLDRVAAALRGAGVPTVVRQGRGYFERPEIRDLVHAVRVAVDPRGTSLAAWLRGPFGETGPAFAAEVVGAADPVAHLQDRRPALGRRLTALRAAVTRDPAAAIATLAYAPSIDGTPFVARLGGRARDNVDALVVDLAERPPEDLERLLDRLDRMARAGEAGDVPQGGDGVTLLTVHAAKGLEWPVVALADVGGGAYEPAAEVAVDAEEGLVAVPGTAPYDELERARRRKGEGETMRALYVAVSRPREVLLVSGVQGANGPGPWLRAFHRAGLGPVASTERATWPVARALGIEVVQHRVDGAVRRPSTPPAPSPAPLPAAPWSGRMPWPSRYPALVSPSWVVLEGSGRAAEGRVRGPWPAPLRAPDAELAGDDEIDPDEPVVDASEGERLAGRATAVGTLVHDAIARGRRPDDAAAMATLAAQEVVFPFSPTVRAELLAEVVDLLAGYWALVDGAVLPPPEARDEDHAELPFAFDEGGCTWHGLVDRLVRVGGSWWLDDYKTDRQLRPERYHVAMATYVEAVARVRGVRPRARLVDLRRRVVVPLDDAELRDAWAATARGARMA